MKEQGARNEQREDNAMQCPKCKTVLPDSVRFCPNDGTPLTDTAATRAESSTPTGGKRPPSVEIALPTMIGGRFRLEEFRGGGGMAKVYRAVDTVLERTLAVKLINPDLRSDPEFDARFQREARISCQLSDPNIVTVHDFGIDTEHGPFLVMEYLHGQSLREYLATEGALPLKAALQVAGGLFMALVAAHEKGYVHRDIKPDNLFLLGRSGVKLTVKVLDFGIARIYRGDTMMAAGLTLPGAVVGTPKYMSPEQLDGKPVTRASDIYSAGLVIYEMLTREVPRAGGKRLCEVVPDAPQSLQDLIDACLRPNPEERPTALEAYMRLNEAGKASGIIILPPGALERLAASKHKNEPTVQYTPGDGQAKKKKTALLLGGLALVALTAMVMTVLLWPTLFPKPVESGPEKLADVALGEPMADVETRLELTLSDVDVDPWKAERTEQELARHPVLTKEDLRLPDADLKRVTVRRTKDSALWVFFGPEKKVIAVLATKRGMRTARGAEIGGKISDLKPKYDSEDDVVNTHSVGGKNVQVHRFGKVGVAFEVKREEITAVALFRPE